MNDDFLTRFRKAPPQEFSETLYERIGTEMNTQRKFNIRRITLPRPYAWRSLPRSRFLPLPKLQLNSVVQEIGGVTFFGPDETEANQTPVPESQITLVPEEALIAF